MAFSISTLNIKGLFVTLSINDIQHKTLSIKDIDTQLKKCHYAVCPHAECRDFLIFMLSNVMLSVIILSVILLSVVTQSVVMLSHVMLSVIIVSVFMLSVVIFLLLC